MLMTTAADDSRAGQGPQPIARRTSVASHVFHIDGLHGHSLSARRNARLAAGPSPRCQ